MFPETVRTACETATDFSINSTKALYTFSCNASWIFFTSSMILFAPVLFETERAQMAELEMSQKQRVSDLNYWNINCISVLILCVNKVQCTIRLHWCSAMEATTTTTASHLRNTFKRNDIFKLIWFIFC